MRRSNQWCRGAELGFWVGCAETAASPGSRLELDYSQEQISTCFWPNTLIAIVLLITIYSNPRKCIHVNHIGP